MSSSEMQLSFDSKPTEKHPHGYWYAYVNGGQYELEAVGPTIESTLANLVNEALKELDRKYSE